MTREKLFPTIKLFPTKIFIFISPMLEILHERNVTPLKIIPEHYWRDQ